MIKRYPDYKTYTGQIKYNNLCCDAYNRLNKRVTIIEEEINIIISQGCKETEVVYNSPTIPTQNINSSSCVTLIQDPIDITTTFNSRYILNSENIVNGRQKTVVNRSDTEQFKVISLFSTNKDGIGGFSNAGTHYNTYIFASKDGSISLIWDDIQNVWSVIRYDGSFQNVT
jgi:hypothetical protein